MRRVVITGMGAITPVGLSVEEFWNSVKEGKTNFAEVTRFDSTNYRAHMAAFQPVCGSSSKRSY